MGKFTLVVEDRPNGKTKLRISFSPAAALDQEPASKAEKLGRVIAQAIAPKAYAALQRGELPTEEEQL